MKISCLFVLALALLTFLSCEDNEQNDNIPHGAFRYTGTYQGTAVVKGWLQFSSTNVQDLRGNWHLEKVGEPAVKLGPQIGDGQFQGSVNDDGLVVLQLNPGNADNNVGLAGRFQGEPFSSNLTGTWTYTGFAGLISQGDFTARK